MQRKTAAALADAHFAGRQLTECLAGVSVEEFSGNWTLQMATERAFMIIGEAPVRVRDSVKSIFELLPGRDDAIGLRTLLVHGYDVIDPVEVPRTAGVPLAKLMSAIDPLLEQAERDGL